MTNALRTRSGLGQLATVTFDNAQIKGLAALTLVAAPAGHYAVPLQYFVTLHIVTPYSGMAAGNDCALGLTAANALNGDVYFSQTDFDAHGVLVPSTNIASPGDVNLTAVIWNADDVPLSGGHAANYIRVTAVYNLL